MEDKNPKLSLLKILQNTFEANEHAKTASFPVIFPVHERNDNHEEKEKKKWNEEVKTPTENIYELFAAGKSISDFPVMNEEGNFIISSSKENAEAEKPHGGKHFKKRRETPAQEKKKNAPKISRKTRYISNYYKHFYTNKQDSVEVRREFSVDVKDFGEPVCVFDYDQLDKLSIGNSEPSNSDFCWKGLFFEYNKKLDKIKPKDNFELKAAPKNVRSKNPSGNPQELQSLKEDPLFQKALDSKLANVFITDLVLATLMAAPKSTLGWDVAGTKQGDNVFFFKRKESDIENDLFEESRSESNDALKNNLKAMSAASAHLKSAAISKDKFVDLGSLPESGVKTMGSLSITKTKKRSSSKNTALRYRSFDLSDQIKVLVKCELESFFESKSGLSPLFTKPFLEPSTPGEAKKWRSSLEVQKGSVLVDEVKSKAFCVARWVAQADLCGCDEIQLAFVGRNKIAAGEKYCLVETMREPLKNLSRPLGLSRGNFWGVFRAFTEEVLNQEGDFNFSFVKDPNNKRILLFRI